MPITLEIDTFSTRHENTDKSCNTIREDIVGHIEIISGRRTFRIHIFENARGFFVKNMRVRKRFRAVVDILLLLI